MQIKIRTELSKFKKGATERAKNGKCEGEAEYHDDDVRAVRAYDRKDGFDWGWYSLCGGCREENNMNGISHIDE